MPGRFELYKDAAGKFRFRLKASNRQIIATGESYKSRASALKGIEAVRRTPATLRSTTKAAGFRDAQPGQPQQCGTRNSSATLVNPARLNASNPVAPTVGSGP
jgi:uncharacterized protein YegP (UPF0339 family)